MVHSCLFLCFWSWQESVCRAVSSGCFCWTRPDPTRAWLIEEAFKVSPSTASWHSSHFFPPLTAHGLFLLSLSVSFFPLELTSLCTSKIFIFGFLHSCLLSPSASFAGHVPAGPVVRSWQPRRCPAAPLGHLDRSSRAAAQGAAQVNAACVTSH